MKQHNFPKAFASGAQEVKIWSQLLDGINVLPVADGDTGRNMVISLAPLRKESSDTGELRRRLLLAARGNAGNIASCFLQEFVCMASIEECFANMGRCRDAAYHAVTEPLPGTMLSFFDRLTELCCFTPSPDDYVWTNDFLQSLERAVADTVLEQSLLEQAHVVDAGALGMYLFFDGFFSYLASMQRYFSPLRACFKDYLKISDAFNYVKATGFCIDAVVKNDGCSDRKLKYIGKSNVVMRSGEYLKVHLHVSDREKARSELATSGNIVAWVDDDLSVQTDRNIERVSNAIVHVMTDAAGSVTREDAAMLGITLLDSYIIIGDSSVPETCCVHADIYKAMRSGTPCSTAQASLEEQRQSYAGALELHAQVLYLCVGSIYTGNIKTACAWKKEHDQENRFTVIDTGTAAGRLAVTAHLVSRCAKTAINIIEVEACVRTTLNHVNEYIFIDKLHYLAAGGRFSNTGAFIGDMLKCKPVISPQKNGAQRVGMTRNRQEQVRFAFERLANAFSGEIHGLMIFQYSDNLGFVQEIAETAQRRYPNTELLVRPLSLSTGVHTGPGSWAVAFAPVV